MGKTVELIVFDLDGTLIDSRDDIAASANHVRSTFGLDPLPLETVASFIGDGVRTLMERVLALNDPSALQRAVNMFRNHYRRHCLDQTRLYPDVLRALEGLREKTLTVLTNKPQEFARRILRGLEILRFFELVVGPESTAMRKPDPEPFRFVLSKTSCDASRALVVGDGVNDISGGRAAGMMTCAVARSESAEREFRSLQPDFLVRDLSELQGLLS